MEIWKDIPGFEGLYQASTLGRIRSVDRTESCVLRGKEITRGRAGRVLRQAVSNGYPFVNLCKDGVSHVTKTHKLVAITFIGPQEDGMTVNHKDLNKKNNRVENLEYVTQAENIRHALENGAFDSHCLLSPEDVLEAKNLYSDGMSSAELAERFGVSIQVIQGALSGRNYGHIEDPDGFQYRGKRALSDAEAIELIKARNTKRERLESLSRRYGVNISAVSRIARGLSYIHLRELYPELYQE